MRESRTVTTVRFIFALSYVALVACAAPIDAAEPRLDRLEPQGGRLGTEVEVTFHGPRLGDAPHQILLYEPGIEAGPVERIDANQVKCKLKLADDCPLGRHALRLRTASGLSTLRTFHVGNLKEIVEAEPNNTAAAPQEIETDVVINGGITQEGDIDVFAVELTEGERLSVEIEGLRLGRTLFDPVVEVRSAAGDLLASNDDRIAAHSDAFVSLLATQAGKVFVTVREASYGGDGNSTYRLHFGRFPRPTAAFPPAAVPGQPAEVTWIGSPASAAKQAAATQTVDIPDTSAQMFEARAKDELGISPTGLPLLLTPGAPQPEVEPNNGRAEATEISAPGVACGIIADPGDKDFYRFTMKKGQEWDFRVRARKVRSPLDAVLHVYDTKGKYTKGNDDDAGQPDSYLRYKAPADGEYQLDVEDRLLRGTPEMVYVLEITKPAPVAELQLDERRRYESQVINVPQGSRTAAMMTVKRVDFGGPLQVEWTGLPEGCTAEAVPLAANYNRVPMLFTAQPESDINATLASVTAKLTEKPRPIESRFRQQTWLVRGRNNVSFWNHFADRAAVAVTQALPYTIRAIQPNAPLVRNGSMELKIIADRNEGFENPIAIRTLYNPPGVSTNQSRSIPKTESEALIPITANGGARLGEWKIVLLGRTSMGGAVETSTQLVTLNIVEAFFDIKIPTITTVQGSSAELVVNLEHRTPFEGEAELQLVRLPPGVSAEKVKIAAGAESAVFALTIAPDARVGRHRGVGCSVLLSVEGEPVRYSQGYVDLSVDPTPQPPPAETAAGSNNERGKKS